MRTLLTGLCLTLFAMPGIFVPAHADLQEFVSNRDATIFSENDMLGIGNGSLFVGRTSNGHLRRALIYFDISTIPSGSTIDDVRLRLAVTRVKGSMRTINVHRMTHTWSEGPSTGIGNGGGRPTNISDGDCSWTFANFNAAGSDSFTTPGGDFAGTASASFANGANGNVDVMSATLISDVQAWLDDPSGNHGWILIGEEDTDETARRLNSKEDSGQKPVLTVEFTPPTSVESASWSAIKSLFAERP